MAGRNRIVRTAGASLLALGLGACGGGGGAPPPVSTPLPPPISPSPTPVPLPGPPPVTGNPLFDTPEYQNSVAAWRANAIRAYEAGATGQGVVAAIVDDSFNPNLPAFAGRVHPASQDVVANRGLNGDHHHGTPVASVLGAAKDDSGIHGVAFNATLLLLRTDTPGTCTATSPTCQFNQTDLAKAFDLAVANGARVINISMAFIPMPPQLAAAIERATAAGVVVILPAANDGLPNPVASAMFATTPDAHGAVIIAGALNNAGSDLATFSNRAGTGAEVYLSAVGEGMKVYTGNGVLASGGYGTSLSAPAIAGAVALLAQAFPNLTGQQIVQLLLTSATDMGAPGTDSIHGRGALNLANAFAPKGATALAGRGRSVSLVNNGTLSPAMGDAAARLPGAVFLDSYGRAYRMDLGSTLSRAAPASPLHSALGSHDAHGAAVGPLSLSITTRREGAGFTPPLVERLRLSGEQSRIAQAMAGAAVARLSPRTAVALGFSESGGALQQRLADQYDGAFLAARDPVADSGLGGRADTSMGVRHDFGPLAFTMTSEAGELRATDPAQPFSRSGYRTTSLSADRALGRLRLSLGASLLDEDATLLGARFSSAFALAGSTSRFVDGAARLDLGAGWSAHATYRHGWTAPRSSDQVVTGGRLSTNAFAFDLARTGALMPGDRLAFRFMQPLRVRSGGMNINLPISYDYASGAVGYEGRLLDLAPTGRELVYELSYGTRLWSGILTANAFLRSEPGHVEWMKDDVGGALRFTFDF